ncbi:MAG: PDZ domain-containing protein [Verrucomicrobiales bacterium]
MKVRRGIVFACFAALVALAAGEGERFYSLPPRFRVNGKSVTAEVEPAAERALKSVFRLENAGEPVALATAVSGDGYLITKASELEGLNANQFRVILPPSTPMEPRLIAWDRGSDLALIKIDAPTPLPVVPWYSGALPEIGVWAAGASGETKQPLRLGVISAKPRPIPRSGGVIGVTLGDLDSEHGVEIRHVHENSAAMAAGLRVGDFIAAINGAPVRESGELKALVEEHDPGEVIRVRYYRGGVSNEQDLTLGHRSVVFDVYSRNQRMSGETSKRRSGFPQIIQHDLPLSPQAMGGPLIGLDGTVLGINIARADRVTTYAIPAAIAKNTAERMMAADPMGEGAIPDPGIEVRPALPR